MGWRRIIPMAVAQAQRQGLASWSNQSFHDAKDAMLSLRATREDIVEMLSNLRASRAFGSRALLVHRLHFQRTIPHDAWRTVT